MNVVHFTGNLKNALFDWNFDETLQYCDVNNILLNKRKMPMFLSKHSNSPGHKCTIRLLEDSETLECEFQVIFAPLITK